MTYTHTSIPVELTEQAFCADCKTRLYLGALARRRVTDTGKQGFKIDWICAGACVPPPPPEIESLVNKAKQLAEAWPDLTPDAQLELLDSLQSVMRRYERKYELLSKNWYQLAQEIQGLMHDDFSRTMRAKAQHYDDVATEQTKRIAELEEQLAQVRQAVNVPGAQLTADPDWQVAAVRAIVKEADR